jgi:hypothetical protein
MRDHVEVFWDVKRRAAIMQIRHPVTGETDKMVMVIAPAIRVVDGSIHEERRRNPNLRQDLEQSIDCRQPDSDVVLLCQLVELGRGDHGG